MPDDNTTPTTPEAPAAPVKAPPWGDDSNWDAARAWTLLQNKDSDLAKLKDKIAAHDKAAQERADAEKSDLEKAIARAEKAEKSLADRDTAAKRKSVLDAHGLTDADAAWLAGVPDDELDAKAAALAERLGIKKEADGEEISTKPAPKLVPGHKTEAPAKGNDPSAVADRIYNGR